MRKILLFVLLFWSITIGFAQDASNSINDSLIIRIDSYGIKKDFKKSLEIEKEGIEICNKYGQLCVLPELIFNLGCSYTHLGNKVDGLKYIKTGLSLIKLFKKDYLREGLKYANDNFNYNLTDKDI